MSKLFSEFVGAEEGAGGEGGVGGDEVDAGGEDHLDILGLVDGPNVDRHAVDAGFIVEARGLEVVEEIHVDAADAVGVHFGRPKVGTEVLHREVGAEAGELAAGVEAEGDKDNAVGAEKPVFFEQGERKADSQVLDFRRCVGFEFEDQGGLVGLLRLGEVLAESRDGFAVLQAVVGELGVGVFLDAFVSNGAVVEDEENAVGGHVDVELATPEAGVLRCLKGREGVAGEAACFAVPEAAMCHDAHLAISAKGEEGEEKGNEHEFHGFTRIIDFHKHRK